MPESYPQIGGQTLKKWAGVLEKEGYAALAANVLALFMDDIPEDDLQAICQRAYRPPKFSHPEIVPVSDLGEGLWLGHLSNGPTAAFKDMAMQLLGELFEYELERRKAALNIVGATSGDTGSAAEYALAGRKNVRVFMLTPQGRMTPFQRAQMFSISADNIFNLAIDGVFDDCQDIVKVLNADADFKRKTKLGAVNSINWARLAAQIVYYISCYLKVVGANLEEKPPVSFCVPTGNFGDICAGHIAKMMGLPIRHLIVATNENNVLEEFFRTGTYRVRAAAETLKTSSPSMDISKASNFERFVFDLLGRNAAEIARLFGQMVPEGGFTLPADLMLRAREKYGFLAGAATHQDRVQQIRELYQQNGVLVDPHTADGLAVAKKVAVPGPVVVLETALPVKFADTIAEAIGHVPPVPPRFAGIEDLPWRVDQLPADSDAVKRYMSARI